MSKYFVQVGYTAEAWAAMSRGPQRVVERVQASAEALGGSIESLYFCFGDYDLMGVVDFPDSRGVAAWSMAVSSGGDVRAFKTTTLLSIEEGLHALGRASQATRAAKLPGAPACPTFPDRNGRPCARCGRRDANGPTPGYVRRGGARRDHQGVGHSLRLPHPGRDGHVVASAKAEGGRQPRAGSDGASVRSMEQPAPSPRSGR
jgi:uncharacterized protein with GYD domain